MDSVARFDGALEENSLLVSDAHSLGTEPLAENSYMDKSLTLLEKMLAGKGLNIHIVERNGERINTNETRKLAA